MVRKHANPFALSRGNAMEKPWRSQKKYPVGENNSKCVLTGFVFASSQLTVLAIILENISFYLSV